MKLSTWKRVYFANPKLPEPIVVGDPSSVAVILTLNEQQAEAVAALLNYPEAPGAAIREALTEWRAGLREPYDEVAEGEGPC